MVMTYQAMHRIVDGEGREIELEAFGDEWQVDMTTVSYWPNNDPDDPDSGGLLFTHHVSPRPGYEAVMKS